MQFERANKLALRAVRHLLSGARPMDVEIEGTRVPCEVKLGEQPLLVWHPCFLHRTPG